MESAIRRQLAQQMDHMKRTGEAARAGMDILGKLTIYAVQQMERILKSCDVIEEIAKAKGAGPELEAAHQRLRAHYLTRVNQITEDAGEKLVNLVNLAPTSDPGVSDSWLDLVARVPDREQ